MRKAALLAALVFWGIPQGVAQAADDIIEIHGWMKHKLHVFYHETYVIEQSLHANELMADANVQTDNANDPLGGIRRPIDVMFTVQMAYLLEFLAKPVDWLDFGIAFSNLGGSRNYEYALAVIHPHDPSLRRQQRDALIQNDLYLRSDLDNMYRPVKGRPLLGVDGVRAPNEGTNLDPQELINSFTTPNIDDPVNSTHVIGEPFVENKLLGAMLARLWFGIHIADDTFRFRMGRFANPLVDPNIQFVWDEDKAIQGMEFYVSAWGFRLWTILHFETNAPISDGRVAAKSMFYFNEHAATLFFATLDYVFNMTDTDVLLRIDYMNSYGRNEVGGLVKAIWYLSEGYPLGVATTFYVPIGIDNFLLKNPAVSPDTALDQAGDNFQEKIGTFGGMTKIWYGDLTLDDSWHAALYVAYFMEMSRILREDDNDLILADGTKGDTITAETAQLVKLKPGSRREFHPEDRFAWDRLTRMADVLINEYTKKAVINGANVPQVKANAIITDSNEDVINNLLILVVGLDVGYRFNEWFALMLEMDFGFGLGTQDKNHMLRVIEDQEIDPTVENNITVGDQNRAFAFYGGLVAMINF